MLLDGCCKADFITIKQFFLHELKRPLSDLKVILVTHMHPDHAGCADQLRRASACQIVSTHHQFQWYRGFSGRVAHLVDILLALWVAGKLKQKRKNIWYSPTLIPDIRIRDKQRIPGFEDWQVFETPGHTDRDLSVMHVPTKRMYVADLIVKVKNKLCAPFPVYFPEAYTASLEKVKRLQPSSLMMAHVEEQAVSDIQFDALIQNAPKQAQTNKQVILRKCKRSLGLKLTKET